MALPEPIGSKAMMYAAYIDINYDKEQVIQEFSQVIENDGNLTLTNLIELGVPPEAPIHIGECEEPGHVVLGIDERLVISWKVTRLETDSEQARRIRKQESYNANKKDFDARYRQSDTSANTQ